MFPSTDLPYFYVFHNLQNPVNLLLINSVCILLPKVFGVLFIFIKNLYNMKCINYWHSTNIFICATQTLLKYRPLPGHQKPCVLSYLMFIPIAPKATTIPIYSHHSLIESVVELPINIYIYSIALLCKVSFTQDILYEIHPCVACISDLLLFIVAYYFIIEIYDSLSILSMNIWTHLQHVAIMIKAVTRIFVHIFL